MPTSTDRRLPRVRAKRPGHGQQAYAERDLHADKQSSRAGAARAGGRAAFGLEPRRGSADSRGPHRHPKPKNRFVASVAAAVKPSTRPSGRTEKAFTALLPSTEAITAGCARNTTETPNGTAAASRKHSVRSCRASRQAPAPSASRIESSRPRAAVRAMSRPARLAQAMRRTSPAIAISAYNCVSHCSDIQVMPASSGQKLEVAPEEFLAPRAQFARIHLGFLRQQPLVELVADDLRSFAGDGMFQPGDDVEPGPIAMLQARPVGREYILHHHRDTQIEVEASVYAPKARVGDADYRERAIVQRHGLSRGPPGRLRSGAARIRS